MVHKSIFTTADIKEKPNDRLNRNLRNILPIFYVRKFHGIFTGILEN